MNKTVHIPYLTDLDLTDFIKLEEQLELYGAKIPVFEVNWKEFPYIPSTIALIARTEKHIVVLYQVRGLDIRATVMDDNEMVCTDSCCEFFVSDPSDGTYYNFEMNCIGTIKAAKRKSRQDYELLSEDRLSRIIRHTSLKRKEIIRSGMHSWRVAMCIPLDLIGIDPMSIPEKVSANFYKCADKSGHPHFLSWNPIETMKPDFHLPEFFGTIVF